VVDGDTASDVRRQLQEAVDDMEEKIKDEVDTRPPVNHHQQQQQKWCYNDGRWRRNRVDVEPIPAAGADLCAFAIVINGSSLVSLAKDVYDLDVLGLVYSSTIHRRARSLSGQLDDRLLVAAPLIKTYT